MKRLLIVAMLVAASSFVFSHPTRSGAIQKGNDEQAIRQLLNEISTALARADTAALDRIYAEDYTLVNESGVLTTKVPRLAAIKSGELKYESVSFDDVNVVSTEIRLWQHIELRAEVSSKGKKLAVNSWLPLPM